MEFDPKMEHGLFLLLFRWCLMPSTNIVKSWARLPRTITKEINFRIRTKYKERMYSAILPHYSSTNSSQGEKLTPNHQQRKSRNSPKCFSWDSDWRVRLAWEPYQKLGINVICGFVNFSAVIPIIKLNSERLKQKRASTPPRIYNHRLHGKEYNLIYTRRKG